MSGPNVHVGVGARIAELRKIHGATQQGLAMRANVSYSLLRKVERGERTATHAFIAAIARTLSVNVIDITEQPYGVRNAGPNSEQSGVPALRLALVEGEDPDIDTPLRDLVALRRDVEQLKEWDRQTRHAEEVRVLPDLLRHLHALATQGPSDGSQDLFELMSEAYSYATIALYRLGHLDLAHLADERARAAAEKGHDPLRAAVAEWNHALILLFDGANAAGMRSTQRAASLVREAHPGSDAAAVNGAVHLRAAILSARLSDAGAAQGHLDAAAAVVDPRHDANNPYGTKFGHINVLIHQVAVPVELADGQSAVAKAAGIVLPEQTAPSRSGHYWIDLSRAWLMHGDRQRAMGCLQAARRIAPQLTRYHPRVRQTVQALAAYDTRSTQSLAGFASWCGIAG